MSGSQTLVVTEVGDRELHFGRTFAAPRGIIFRAFTDPARIRQWLLAARLANGFARAQV
jgi:uncharacterized protein YndB with AHSA1/START domain